MMTPFHVGSGNGQMGSPKLSAFTKLKPDLVDQLQYSFPPLKDQCQAEGLITYAQIQATFGARGITPAEETSMLLDIILARIRMDPSICSKFMSLKLLQEHADGALIRQMG